MKLPLDAMRLTVYIGDRDQLDGRPLFEAIVTEARARGLAGATVYNGVLGYGANSRVRTAKILMLSQDLPVVVEIVDASEKIDAFLPWLDEAIGEGMITLEPVRVALYRHGKAD